MGSAPSELGPYRLGRRIAVGGMAEVFAATRISDGAAVAIKVLLPQYARDPEFVRMLEDEARVQTAVAHPNLVRLIEFGRAGKQPYLALELVDGASLRDVLRAGALPPQVAVHAVADVLRALVAVHAGNVVHRDVTPENILIARDGTVRLGDFGIARSALAGGRTRTGVIKGKLAYLAPEQVKAALIGPHTDLYAVGLVLFEAIAGEPYLRGDTEPELLRAAEAPVWRSSGHAHVDDVLRALLAVDPAARPKSAADALARVEALGGSAADLVERVEQARHDDIDERPRTVRVEHTPSRRRPFVLVGGALAIAAAAIVGGIWLAGRDQPREVAILDAMPRAPTVDTPTIPIDDAAVSTGDVPAVDASITTTRDATRPDAKRPSTNAVAADAMVIDAMAVDAKTTDIDGLAKLRADYRARGILDADLPADARALLDAGALVEARRAIEAIRIDDAFVKRKLDRIHAAIRRADRGKVDIAELDRLAAAALDDLLDARYDACNARLNQIAKLLGQSQ